MTRSTLDDQTLADLVCPICGAANLQRSESQLDCPDEQCGGSFPLIDGCPVLINESNSVFAIDDYQQQRVTTMDLRDPSEKPVGDRLKHRLSKLFPSISRSVNDFPVSDALREIATELGCPPRVLVVGSGDAELELPAGSHPIYSDVAKGRLTQIIFDAHDIPFPDGYFDAVVAVAVLEHVADPYRCADEIHRVLTPKGFVYSITPFMQQVHMGRYDFTRFTHLGHRRLFRRFDERRSGVANAQGMVVSWSLVRFFSGFSESPTVHNRLRSLARFAGAPFLWFDGMLAHKSPAYDCASAYYFFGTRSEQTLSDRELIKQYRGMS